MPLRDISRSPAHRRVPLPSGRCVIATIGIDCYRHWPRLYNAVSDAHGARERFLQLGFEEVVPPLIDGNATGQGIRTMTTALGGLSRDDSLVVFFAGHGHTEHHAFTGRTPVKTGYIVPVDASMARDRTATMLRLDLWLSDLARLPPRHLLVILDACYCGVALNAVDRWRGHDDRGSISLDELHRRRSRRVITSAMDNQRARDSGPMPGHSLFTGCLLEALTVGLAGNGRAVATGTELGLYVQQRVILYPDSTQTPDFGALELDDRGELLLHLAAAPAPPEPATDRDLRAPRRTGQDDEPTIPEPRRRARATAPEPVTAAETQTRAMTAAEALTALVAETMRRPGWSAALAAAIAAVLTQYCGR
jgi:hypothetical protein